MAKVVVTEFVSLDGVMEDPAQLLGRRTYEAFAKAWPSTEDEAGFATR